jgi:divalent metal cation (Fe/Co/Zn/Cd) transporter
MRSFRSIVWRVGIVGGIVFAVHASFPNVYSWPMIWPPITGATAFWLATRQPAPHRLRTGLAATVAAAVIAGVVAFVGISIVVTVALHVMHPTPAELGVPNKVVTAASIAALASLAGITIIEAIVGGIVALPVRHLQTRSTH